jgi:hypothetical protein
MRNQPAQEYSAYAKVDAANALAVGKRHDEVHVCHFEHDEQHDPEKEELLHRANVNQRFDDGYCPPIVAARFIVDETPIAKRSKLVRSLPSIARESSRRHSRRRRGSCVLANKVIVHAHDRLLFVGFVAVACARPAATQSSPSAQRGADTVAISAFARELASDDIAAAGRGRRQ